MIPPKHDPITVLVVGQVPPPHHGQAVMIERLLAGHYPGITLHHVPMRFSADLDEIGRLRLGKLSELVRVILAIHRVAWRTHPRILYYPPAGPDLIPMLRDGAILLATRWLFPKTIFHFHAGGVGLRCRRLPWPLRSLLRAAYHGADIGIRTTTLAPPDPEILGIRADHIVPNGIDDRAAAWLDRRNRDAAVPTILYVGLMCEEKGVLVLLDALARLRQRGARFRAVLVGAPAEPSFTAELVRCVGAAGLADVVTCPGQLIGEDKWRAYADADIFCFPSFYRSEAFPLVVIEALSFALPVVSTLWRGIPDIVADTECGYLVPPHDADALADRLQRLLADPDLRQRLGENGRQRFLSRFTSAAYRRAMEAVFRAV